MVDFAALADRAAEAVFAHAGDAAELRAADGRVFRTRVVLATPREGALFGAADLVRTQAVADLPARQVRPAAGDLLIIGAQGWRVAGAPSLSSDGLYWRCELARQPGEPPAPAAPPPLPPLLTLVPASPPPPPPPARLVEEEEEQSRLAGEPLSALRAVRLLPDLRAVACEPADAASLAGLAVTAAAAGAAVSIRTAGVVRDASWSWTPGLPLFLAPGGALTHTPPGSGPLRQVAIAQAADAVLLAFGPLVLRP